jgi:hypothetical protein
MISRPSIPYACGRVPICGRVPVLLARASAAVEAASDGASNSANRRYVVFIVSSLAVDLSASVSKTQGAVWIFPNTQILESFNCRAGSGRACSRESEPISVWAGLQLRFAAFSSLGKRFGSVRACAEYNWMFDGFEAGIRYAGLRPFWSLPSRRCHHGEGRSQHFLKN